MSLINCEINLILIRAANCITCEANRGPNFAITDTKHYVSIVTLSIQDNTKLLQQLQSRFKRTTNWNKYQLKVLTQDQYQYLDYLIDPSCQGVNKLFSLTFENNADKTGHSG